MEYQDEYYRNCVEKNVTESCPKTFVRFTRYILIFFLFFSVNFKYLYVYFILRAKSEELKRIDLDCDHFQWTKYSFAQKCTCRQDVI